MSPHNVSDLLVFFAMFLTVPVVVPLVIPLIIPLIIPPIITLTLLAAACIFLSAFKADRKPQTAAGDNGVVVPTSLKALDWGILATLRFAWKSQATLWDDIPPYERVLEVMNEHKVKLMRMCYVVNWSSAGRIVGITDLQTSKEVFRSRIWQNRFEEGHYLTFGMFKKNLGIMMSSGRYWKESRRAVMIAFRETNLLNVAHIEGLYLEEVKNLLVQLRHQSASSGDVIFSPHHMFDYPVLHVVFQFLFGRRLREKDPLEGTLMDQLNLVNSTFSFAFGAFDCVPFLKYFMRLLPTGRAYLRMCHSIYEITALERDCRTKEKYSSGQPKDVMDSLLRTVDEHASSCPNYFTFQSLQVTIRDLILTGSDTTNVALQHMIRFMAMHPEKQEKVYNEIDAVVGHGRWPKFEDRTRMIYTQAMLLETLRLGTVVPVSWRLTNKDCTLGDLKLKKGTYLAGMYIGIHTSEDLWEDPFEFQPERFINEEGCIVNTDKILPFACGPRACPGELNGRVAMFMFTVALLREFKWELSDVHPPPSMKCLRGLSRAPVPYFVKMSRRNNVPFG